MAPFTTTVPPLCNNGFKNKLEISLNTFDNSLIMTIALTPKQEVCQLYRRCLRVTFDWVSQRDSHRRMCLAIRRQFDLHSQEADIHQQKLLKDACRYLLWDYRHPEPYICKNRVTMARMILM